MYEEPESGAYCGAYCGTELFYDARNCDHSMSW